MRGPMTSPSPDGPARPTRIIFLGTPEFATPVLRALLNDPDITVPLVVTQPDRPAGRGRRLATSPVKELAVEYGVSVYQPERLRGAEAVARLREAEADLFVIAAYGQILRQAILDIPAHGCLNVHPSLLPRHRGPSPIAAAILANDTTTGVTIMLTDRGMDTGPILTQETVPLPGDATTTSLTPQLFEQGAALLLRTIPAWLAGRIAPRPQDDALATVTRTFSKADGAIDWTDSAEALDRQVRALNFWPRAYTFDGDKRLIVLDTRVGSGGEALPAAEAAPPPGTIVAIERDGPRVATGAGTLILREVQPEGRRPVDGGEFARSQPGLLGRRLSAYQDGTDGA